MGITYLGTESDMAGQLREFMKAWQENFEENNQ
jgi:hypothetical protein